MFSVVAFIIWLIAGILALLIDEIPKVLYGITWFCFMTQLFVNCMEYIK